VHRQLESLIRLTEARAKMELREEATEQDARDIVEIMQQSICDAMMDEMGKYILLIDF
jgi:DNA helicase MCM8